MKLSIASLRAAGVTAEVIVTAIEAEQTAAIEKRREQTRERVRRHRERNASNALPSDVTPVTTVTRYTEKTVGDQQLSGKPTNIEKGKEDSLQGSKEEKKESKEVRKKERLSSDFFERFWLERARRKGSDPRAPCEAKFKALVKSGEDPEAIIAGMIAHAAAARAEGKFGTEFVMQTIRFLNQRHYRDYAENTLPAAVGGPPPGCRSSEEILAEIEEQKRADIRGVSEEGAGAHPGGEKNGAGPLFCDQSGDARMGKLEKLLHQTVRAASMGNVRRSQ
jgi:hypothetical protein